MNCQNIYTDKAEQLVKSSVSKLDYRNAFDDLSYLEQNKP